MSAQTLGIKRQLVQTVLYQAEDLNIFLPFLSAAALCTLARNTAKRTFAVEDINVCYADEADF